MKKRFTEEQILKVLSEGDKGTETIQSICRKYGISDKTFYDWRKKYKGMNVPELRRYKEMEKENARLKKLLAERDVEIDAMKELLSKNW